jgi:carboxymethylenebutenolidase
MTRSADETTSVRLGEREIPVEIFTPTETGPRPALVVIHEVYGLNNDIRRISRRFADEGFVAAAPDLMSGGFRIRNYLDAAQGVRTGAGPMVDALESIVRLLESRQDVTRVGAVGFCMGGGFALLLGTRDLVSAAGVYYGEIRTRDELARACPLMGGYGGKDRIFAPKGRKLIEQLEELGKEHDVRLYEEAGHSYMNRAGHSFRHSLLSWLSRPLMHIEYNEEAAEDSWGRMLPFFRTHLA